MRPSIAHAARRRAGAGLVLATATLLATAAQAADGRFSASGYVHYDARDFSETVGAPGESSEVRRVRPIFQYKSSRWSARLMPDLMRDTNQVLDAYLDFSPAAPWDLRVGRFKSPLSLNRLQSANALALMENSVVAAMTPNRDNGVLLGFDTVGEAHWRFEAGAFDGAADDEVKGSLDRDVEWTVRALRTRPLASGVLRFGLGASAGERHGEAGDPRLSRQRTAGRATWFRHAGEARSDGDTDRVIAFADYHGGPWFAQAEAIRARETVRLGPARAELAQLGWELQASRVLTGEARADSGVTPGNLRLPGLDLPVAIEVGARLGQVRIDSDAFRLGLADPAGNGERLRVAGVSVGLWFPRQWRLLVDYEDSRVRRPGDLADLREKVLMARAVIAF